MGAYNTFLTEEECPRCHELVTRRYQFKFGDKWLHEYRAGDELLWGGNDEGDSGQPLVLVDAIREWCPQCGNDSDDWPYRVRVEYDRLVGVEGPVDYSSLLFGSSISQDELKIQLEGLRERLGLWSQWEETSIISNMGDWFWVTENGSGTQGRYGVEWRGPSFLQVLHTTRPNELLEILASLPLTRLERKHPLRRAYSEPEDKEAFVDSRHDREAIEEGSQFWGLMSKLTGHRYLVYENEGELPVLVFNPGSDMPVRGPGWIDDTEER